MNITAQRVDSWTIVTSNGGNGLQIMKNGRNIRFSTSFDEAWSFVTNQGTPGDKIEIRVNGVLNVS